MHRQEDEALGRLLIKAGQAYCPQGARQLYLLEFLAGPTKGESGVLGTYTDLHKVMEDVESTVPHEQQLTTWQMHRSPFGCCWEMPLKDGSRYLIAEVEQKPQ